MEKGDFRLCLKKVPDTDAMEYHYKGRNYPLTMGRFKLSIQAAPGRKCLPDSGRCLDVDEYTHFEVWGYNKDGTRCDYSVDIQFSDIPDIRNFLHGKCTSVALIQAVWKRMRELAFLRATAYCKRKRDEPEPDEFEEVIY